MGVADGDFSVRSFGAAMDVERQRRGLSRPQLAAKIWDQSAGLNAVRNDHPRAASTLRACRQGAGSRASARFHSSLAGAFPESLLVGHEPVGVEWLGGGLQLRFAG